MGAPLEDARGLAQRYSRMRHEAEILVCTVDLILASGEQLSIVVTCMHPDPSCLFNSLLKLLEERHGSEKLQFRSTPQSFNNLKLK